VLPSFAQPIKFNGTITKKIAVKTFEILVDIRFNNPMNFPNR
jgi:hypothetical protein